MFEGLASPANGQVRKELLDIISSIADGWELSANRKRKLGYFASPPDYSLEKSWSCHEIEDTELSEILRVITNIRDTRKLPGSDYNGSKLIWEVPSLDIMQGSFTLTKDIVCNRFREAYAIFNRCLIIPSPNDTVVGEARLHFLNVKKAVTEKAIKRETAPARKKHQEALLAEYKAEIGEITGKEVP